MTGCILCDSSDLAADIKPMGRLCGSCLIGIVERRIKKDVRRHHLFRKGERVLVVDDGSTAARVMADVMGNCLGGLPIQREDAKTSLDLLDPKVFSEYDKVLLPLSADDLAEDFLRWLFGKEMGEQNGIAFLSCLLDCEIDAYAKAKGMVVSPKEPSSLRADILRFESRYPGFTHGLLKSSSDFAKTFNLSRCARKLNKCFEINNN